MEECGHKENHSNGMDNGEFKVAVSTTLHCLTGCAVGEILGLIIGVGLGLSVVGIVVLATTLAYVSGFTLGLLAAGASQNDIEESPKDDLGWRGHFGV